MGTSIRIIALINVCQFLYTSNAIAEQNLNVSKKDGALICLTLPITKITDRPQPYKDFCNRNPIECSSDGASQIELNAKTLSTMIRVNGKVNREITFALDIDQYNQEEYWELPRSGSGDCEDIALEKRRRLAQEGFPRAAMRIIVGSHKEHLYSHAMLSVETSNGIYILDMSSEEVTPCYLTQYNFEAKERSDGMWNRYDQKYWPLD